jgi:hypothetical protein
MDHDGRAAPWAVGAEVDLVAKRIIIHREEGQSDTMTVTKVRRGTAKYGRRWSVIFEEAAAAISRLKMPPTTSRLLWHLVATCDARAWTDIEPAEVALAMGVDRSSIARGLIELHALGLIQRDNRRRVRLSLFIAWRGTATAYQAELRRRKGETVDARARIAAAAEGRPVGTAAARRRQPFGRKGEI